MPDHESAKATILAAIALYEAKIADKTISASDMGMYLKLLEKKGWDRDLAEAPKVSLVSQLPIDCEEEVHGSDRIIKFK